MIRPSPASIVAASANAFRDDLRTEGFDPIDEDLQTWQGTVTTSAGRAQIEIRLTPYFPFASPAVKLLNHNAVVGWHQERDGTLCLWSEPERDGMPWLDIRALLRKVEQWIESDHERWEGVPAGLELEAYFEPDTEMRLVLVGEHDDSQPYWLRLRPNKLVPTRLEVIDANTASRSVQKLAAAEVAGLILSLGSVDAPLRDWDALRRHLAADLARDAELWARTKGSVVLVLNYGIAGKSAVCALRLRAVGGGFQVYSLITADASPAARELRGGVDRTELATKRVAIVGLGAVGSRVADELARAGVGALHLIDNDILLPGNIVRHLCGDDLVGLTKSVATGFWIGRRGYPGNVDVTTSDEKLVRLEKGATFIQTHDLVIDATGSGVTTRLLSSASKTVGRPFLSVAIEGHGQYARVDVIPTPDGMRAIDSGGVRTVPLLDAVGCGDPVSPTSPSAVASAGAIGAGFALSYLLGNRSKAGIRVELSSN